MFRLPRRLFVVVTLIVSAIPMVASAAPLGRVPLAESTAAFDGYYGYDGKYHRPYNTNRPASPLDTMWRPSGYSRSGSGGYWGRAGR